ncbi:MAG: hypothetical protein IJW99_12050 [Clostridia bacterium]|nr:hypothetical protein [Clostridia bacterium]
MNQYTIKRALALALAGLMTVTALACGKAADEAPDTTTAATTAAPAQTTTATEATEATTKYLDDLPEDLSYAGKTVNFLYREEIAGEFWSDNINGDIANDAIYDSIMEVEERFGVDIQATLRKGHTTNVRTEYMDHIDNQILAGEAAYDWVDQMIGKAPTRMQTGNFVNLLTLQNLDLSKPWYIPNMEETAAINNRLYFLSGDSSLGYLKCAFCYYYNKDLGAEYNIEDLDAVVRAGKWTIEKVKQIATQTSADLNNDGKWTTDDQLGFVCHDNNHYRGYTSSMKMSLFTKQADGTQKYTFGGDRDHAAITALSELQNNTAGVYYFDGSSATASKLAAYQDVADKFSGGNIFIITAEMGNVIDCGYHTMEDTYGVLPYPKYDEAQESYYTNSRSTHNAFMMPTTCTDPEMAAAVMEALSATKYQKVFPAYYEVVLKTKYAADSESAEMFDIIHDSMVLEFGLIYDDALGYYPMNIVKKTIANIGSFASLIKAESKIIEKTYEKMITNIETHCTD